jgi:hypothetical protein
MNDSMSKRFQCNHYAEDRLPVLKLADFGLLELMRMAKNENGQLKTQLEIIDFQVKEVIWRKLNSRNIRLITAGEIQ